jgi:uncharacterized protein
VVAHPPGSPLDGFDWRISIAEVRSGGPFSVFRGIERLMAVLSGRLSFTPAGGTTQVLTADSPPLRFSGELAVNAAPLDGAVTDLNVMTRTVSFRAELSCHTLDAVLPLELSAPRTVIIVLIPASLRAGGESLALAELDAVELSGLSGCELASASGRPGRIYVAAILPAGPWQSGR